MPDEERNESDNFYPLDDVAIALFAQGLKQIEAVNAEMSGALKLYLRQHKLEGNWRLADNGRELQRMESVPVQQ